MLGASVGSYPAYHIVLMKASDQGELIWQESIALEGGSLAMSGVHLCSSTSYLISGTFFAYDNQADVILIMTGPEIIEGISGNPSSPPSTATLSAFPNPFNVTTTLSLSVPWTIEARLMLYDLRGREVTEIIRRTFEAGDHRIAFDASKLPSGVYFLNARSAGLSMTQKLFLLK